MLAAAAAVASRGLRRAATSSASSSTRSSGILRSGSSSRGGHGSAVAPWGGGGLQRPRLLVTATRSSRPPAGLTAVGRKRPLVGLVPGAARGGAVVAPVRPPSAQARGRYEGFGLFGRKAPSCLWWSDRQARKSH